MAPPAPLITAPADEPREDPAAFAFDPFSHGLQWEPQLMLPAEPAQPIEAAQPVQPMPPEPAPIVQELPKEHPKAVNGAPKPAAIQVAKPSGPLAPIMALSAEEKVALFS